MIIALSFDIDWAPEEVIQDCVDLLGKFSNVNATFFATHASEVLKHAAFEIGIHPNFNKLLLGEDRRNFKEIIDSLVAEYPGTLGFRAHSLTNSSIIFDYITSIGIRYECNVLLPYSKYLHITRYPSGLFRLPFNFEDDVHFTFRRPFDLSILELANSELHVFNFHPIHIYLNTAAPEHYADAKAYYQRPAELLKRRNWKVKGARDLLIELLMFANRQELPVYSLKQLIENRYGTLSVRA